MNNIKTDESEEGYILDNTSRDKSDDIDPAQMKVVHAVEELMDELDTECHCDVDVTLDGKWCTFEGTVDSQEIRTALFDLVPSRNGKRYIVDRLHVTYDVGHESGNEVGH
ncbi:MAG: hypothetical protein JXR76_22980 [Deltaproteobacteria bacterium]|nr:hypothetical protein [Deltaproteobacteria bacterium]